MNVASCALTTDDADYIPSRRLLSVLCRAVVVFVAENSTVDYARFQAVATIKEAVVREWVALSTEDVVSLRCLLLNYVVANVGWVVLFFRML